MKVLLKNAIIKKILVVFITIIMISNFIMPNYVQAGFLDEVGGTLVSGFFQLLTYVGDVALSAMQRMMKGTWDLQEYGEYAIKYSPGMIFANEVAALDINFISANENDSDIISYYVTDAGNDEEMDELIKTVNRLVGEGTISKIRVTTINRNGSQENNQEFGDSAIYENDDNGNILQTNYGARYVVTLTDMGEKFEVQTVDGVAYCKEAHKNIFGWVNLWDSDIKNMIDLKFGSRVFLYVYRTYLYQWEIDSRGNVEIFRYDLSSITEKKDIEIQSTAYQLRGTIATWYIALRTIALVGLLSVLLYIGIRIILSSTSAQDKAKYKNMLKDWLVAICILFLLHYIMAFMLNITEKLNDIISTNVIEKTTSDSLMSNGNKVDILMSQIRNDVNGDGDNQFADMENAFDIAANAIMYLALVILTGIFTIQYLKRVVFMAFLTIIAPMIALTYPLDKVKDGKAQAFSYWLREYIFNCLIQPVHLLLYTVLIVSAFEFAKENILYSIVALAFMVPAEKFIKEMFGMKSSSPTGTLGAAAGGALVMSMLNKIKSKPPKEGVEAAGAGAASSPSGTRTARQAYGTNNQTPQPQGALQPQIQNQAQAQTTPQMANQGMSGVNGQPTDHLQMPQAPEMAKPSKRRVAKTLGYGALKGIAMGGKKFSRSFGGALLGATSGTVALAAQVADGDLFDNPEKALQETGVTAGIGYAAGYNLVGSSMQSIKNGVSSIKKGTETLKKSYYGTEAYNNMKFDEQFFASDKYKIIKEDSEIIKKWGEDNIKQVANSYLNQGITDDKIIRDGMKAGVNGNEYKAASSLGVTDVKDYARVRDKNKNANKQLNAAQIAARMQIAKNMPQSLYNDENGFVRYAKRYGIENEEDARRLFREIDDFV